MKEGTKVKVIDEVTGHEFDIGEIVTLKYSDNDDLDNLGFYSEKNGVWYMSPDEYEIVDKNHVLDMLSQAFVFAVEQKLNEDTINEIKKALSAVVEEV